MTPAILASKQYRRYLERIWRRNPSALNRSRLTRQAHLCNRQMSKAKSVHYSKIIAEHSGDCGSLWRAFNKLLHLCPKIHLPDHSSIATLTNTFRSFLINKISVIRSSFRSDSHSRVLNPPDTRKVLQNLGCVSADDVRHLILLAPCKSSDLDPIPTSLVKYCIDILITPITSLINLSLTEGSFPSHLKCANISPLLKKPSLNKDNMANYRPVPNFRYLSKVLEKVVVNQLNTHINSSNTSNQYRSEYRKFHSTEAALLKIHSDILTSIGAGKVTALTLLDLSAVFDTIDHTILLSRLDQWFGVTGKALNWCKSYLTGRCQRNKIGDCLSSKADLKFGVPQGSVLGPLLFTLYTTRLSSMIFEHAIPHHFYADDSQMYVSFPSGGSVAALNALQSCLASIQSWMSTNKLKLNPDKTEFLLIGNKQQRSKHSLFFQLSFSVSKLTAKSARNLGVIFDTNFTFRSHISVVCNSCFHYMRDLRGIRRHLDLDSAKLLATALVSSSLDYCNSLLYGIADIDLTRLQRVQNQLARLVTKSPPSTRSIPLLRSLHWLPVRFRILFKINLLTYKTPREKQPVYLHFMLAASIPSRSLRSNNDNSFPSLGSRLILVLELFTLAPHLFGTTSHCLSVQPVQLLHSRNMWRHISLIWSFPHRYRHHMACWCYGTVSPIWLSRHWAWLRLGYWRYRSLIDWFIDWYV